jgi:hypothetical protein
LPSMHRNHVKAVGSNCGWREPPQSPSVGTSRSDRMRIRLILPGVPTLRLVHTSKHRDSDHVVETWIRCEAGAGTNGTLNRSSRMSGNHHVRFYGEGVGLTQLPYPRVSAYPNFGHRVRVSSSAPFWRNRRKTTGGFFVLKRGTISILHCFIVTALSDKRELGPIPLQLRPGTGKGGM